MNIKSFLVFVIRPIFTYKAQCKHKIFSCIFLLALTSISLDGLTDAYTIDATNDSVVIHGLTRPELKQISQLTELERRDVISVYISDDYFRESTIALSVLGKTILSPEGLKFIPSSPFELGQQYLLVFSLEQLSKIWMYEEFFTIPKPRPTNQPTLPLEYLVAAAKNYFDDKPAENISINAIENSVSVKGLSALQLRNILALSNSKQQEIISVFETKNNNEDDLYSETKRNAVQGNIIITTSDIKFIPKKYFVENKKYLLILSLQPIGEILFQEEIFTAIIFNENNANPTEEF